jgi:hypothetical protein
MKKLGILVLILIGVSAMAFADFQIGAVGMYKGDPLGATASTLGLNDFTFGADARLKLSIFQGSLAVLYYPEDSSGPVALPASLMALTDIGLSFNILFLRIGAGVGPDFTLALGQNDWTAQSPIPVGLNAKVSAEVMLGKISLGLVGYYFISSISDLAKPNFVNYTRPWVGISAMFKLF